MKRVITSILIVVILVYLMVPAVFAKICEDPNIESIPLWNADENWEDNTMGFELDTQNQVEGSGCVSLQLTASESSRVQLAFVHFPAVDATAWSALEFDLYISDTAALSYMEKNGNIGGIELASPVVDNTIGESLYRWSQLIPQMRKSGLVEGWNHVVIPLRSMTDPSGNFDQSNVCRLRIYWLCSFDGDENGTLKLDNFRLTNRRGSAPDYHDPFEGYFSCGADGHSTKCGNCGEYLGSTEPHTFSDWHVERQGWFKKKELVRQCIVCQYEQREEATGMGCSSSLSYHMTFPLIALLSVGHLLKKRK